MGERILGKDEVSGSIPDSSTRNGRLAQLEERLFYTEDVGGSNPSPATTDMRRDNMPTIHSTSESPESQPVSRYNTFQRVLAVVIAVPVYVLLSISLGMQLGQWILPTTIGPPNYFMFIGGFVGFMTAIVCLIGMLEMGIISNWIRTGKFEATPKRW